MNEKHIRYTFELMKQDGDVIEVRFFQGNKTFSGYFDNVDALVKDVVQYGQENIYFVMNKIKHECLSRLQYNRIMQVDKKMNATSDSDIEHRTWLLIDVDSLRSTGISASDEEKKASGEVANKIYAYLRDIGFSEPIAADSGNGYHLIYRIDMKNDSESRELIDKFLKSLDVMFSNSMAQVDKSVFNASRITKLYGTFARKGRSTEERPHRQSGIMKAPSAVKVTPVELIKKVADLLPQPEKPTYSNNYGKSDFSLENFLSRNGIRYRNKVDVGGAVKYELEHCVFDHSHKGKDAVIFQMANGAIGYKCLHNSCSHYKWQDVRLKFEPNAYQKKFNNTGQRHITPQPKQVQPKDEKGEKFLCLSDIERIDRSKIVTIPSGLIELDKKIIGFNKGELSIWSGNNASGKSTLLGQLCLNACEKGFKAMIYSGELTPNRMKDWLHLQAAGRQYTKPSQYEYLYFTPTNIQTRIDLWLKDKLFIYNNRYGNEFNQMLTELRQVIKEKQIDVIVLDNLMSMDLYEISDTENRQQTKAILQLADFVKEMNVHIHLVAHPRKSTGFLRKIDIAGSGNLANAVDNIFIVHRVNNDFVRNAGDFFGLQVAAQYSTFSNVIEVCKNRDLGVMDYLVGLFYEIESKRFLNERYENLVFGWQDLFQQTEIKNDEHSDPFGWNNLRGDFEKKETPF